MINWREITFHGVDGTELLAREVGPADGPAVLLADGVGCDGYIWRYLTTDLIRSGYRVLHFQYRGHGRSERPQSADRIHIVDHADDLALCLDAFSAPTAALIGHSMGVQVIFETWRRHRERVSCLVAVAGSAGRPLDSFGGEDLLLRLQPLIATLARRGGPLFRRVWRRALRSRASVLLGLATELNAANIRVADFSPYLQTLSEMQPTDFIDMVGAAGRHDARDILSIIDVPTAVIAAERDGYTPERLSKAMADIIPGARYHVILEGSHAAPLEFPERMNPFICAFLDAQGLDSSHASH